MTIMPGLHFIAARRPWKSHLSLVFMMLAGLSTAAPGAETETERSQSDPPLDQALARISETPTPFELKVDCTGDKGARNLRLFSDGMALWDDRLEFSIKPEERQALAGLLVKHDFVSLEAEYGGKPQSQLKKAPLRIICSIDVRLDDLHRSARQFADGEQSARLKALAEALLDFASPLADERGIGAENLREGLEKLASGRLTPHVFELRFLEMPANGQSGSILRIEGKRLALQTYAPGLEVGEKVILELDRADLAGLAERLVEADVASMPVNLWSPRQLEIQIGVLNHRKSLLARKFMRMSADSLGATQQRFDELVEALRATRTEWAPDF